jgi:hypothetical protein
MNMLNHYQSENCHARKWSLYESPPFCTPSSLQRLSYIEHIVNLFLNTCFSTRGYIGVLNFIGR